MRRHNSAHGNRHTLPAAATLALYALQRAKDAGGGALRQQYLLEAQQQTARIDPVRDSSLVRQIQAQVLSLQGRGTNTKIAHLSPGEIVIPRHLLTPEFMTFIRRHAKQAGIDPATLVIGSGRNSLNRYTGLVEFDDDAIDDTSQNSTGDSDGSLDQGTLNPDSGAQIATNPTGQPTYDPTTGISCPVLNPQITSHFGDTKGRPAPHDGVDFRNPVGSPAFATEDGAIKNIGPSDRGGNQIIIQNDSGSVSGYAHTDVVDGLQVGDRVQSGQQIGSSDNSGTANAHLHYTYRPALGAARIDPIRNQIGNVCFPHGNNF